MSYEFAVPIGSYDLELEAHAKKYYVDIDTVGFTRTGSEGALKVVRLQSSDFFEGEVLSGNWRKVWNGFFDGGGGLQPFTAILNGSGTLRFEGETDTAGSWGRGFICSNHLLPLVNGLEIIFTLEVPEDDSGVSINRDYSTDFMITKDKHTTDLPSGDKDYVRFRQYVDETGYLNVVEKNINDSGNVMFSGPQYTHGVSPTTGALEGTVWRIVFHDGVYGAASPSDKRHMHVYIKQEEELAGAEGAAENQLNNSPYDISDLLFDVGHIAIGIQSQKTSVFDLNNWGLVTKLIVNYPSDNIEAHYRPGSGNRNTGEVQLYDDNPATTGRRIRGLDHDFANNIYLQNGFLRLIIQDGTNNGFANYFYDVNATGWDWNGNIIPRDETNSQDLAYPWILEILENTPEKVVLLVKFTDSGTNNDDKYMICQITLERGRPWYKVEPVGLWPGANWGITLRSPNNRFGYAGNGDLSDNDLNINASNTTLSDNFIVMFDDDADKVLAIIGTNKKPTEDSAALTVTDGALANLDSIAYDKLDTSIITIGLPYYAEIADLFREAEVAPASGVTTTGTDDVVDAAASGGFVVDLDALNEYLFYDLVAGTNIQAGRFKAIWRAKDLNQVASDLRLSIENSTDSVYRGENHIRVDKTLTASFAYYEEIFDVTDQDVTDGDTIRLRAHKSLADVNVISIDCIHIVPLGNGQEWTQDITHDGLRGITRARRPTLR